MTPRTAKVTLVAVLAFAASTATAAVPTTITFQGLLADSAGQSLDTTLEMTFSIYDLPAAGSVLWTETQPAVAVTKGVFRVYLGAVTPLADTVFTDSERYLGIQVGLDAEQTPRVRLATVPYALRVATLDGSRGGLISGGLEFTEREEGFDPPYIYVYTPGGDSLTPRVVFGHLQEFEQGVMFYYPNRRAFGFGVGSGITTLFIDPTNLGGRVGIGTQTPEATLEVVGTLRAQAPELGLSPTRSGNGSTVGGGLRSTATGNWATTAGGADNTSNAQFATVSGGQHNVASGQWSTVPGGDSCGATAEHTFAAGRRAKAMHKGAFVWGDQTNADVASTAEDQFQIRAKGGANIFTDSALTAGVTLPAGASAWAPLSDRSVKRNIRPVDGADVLARLAELPVSRWSYAAQDPSIEHVGPMAQDFYRLFGLGDDDQHISTLDPDGISLAAIKELHRQNRELSERVDELERLIAELRSR